MQPPVTPKRACLADFCKPARPCVVTVEGRIYELRVTPMYSSAGEEAARVCVLRDITEARRAATWQAHQERLSVVGEIASAIAHELNNPLTAITMFSQMLLDQLERGSEVHQFAEVIHRNTLACRQTLLGLLETTRNAPAERVEIGAGALVEDVIELLRPLAARMRVELRALGEAGEESVYADEHQLRQALVNLVMNAIRAAGESAGGEVRIGTETRGQDVVIRVEDNGSGVPAALADRIFEPFFTTRAAGEGTGLGLSISRRIIETHGGRLVLCPGAGQGAVFEIRLPRMEDLSHSAEAPLELDS